jgi:hypothetical protein
MNDSVVAPSGRLGGVLGVQLILGGDKVVFRKKETMFGTEAEQGKEPLRWLLRVATMRAHRNENNDSQSRQS